MDMVHSLEKGSVEMGRVDKGEVEEVTKQLQKVKFWDKDFLREDESSATTETGGGEGQNLPTLGKDDKRENSDCSKLFMNAMSKKTNMYSTFPLPLNNPWTFWVERSRRGVGVEEFEANLKRIYTVYTVHLFWSVYHNIPQPSMLHARSSLHMTRDERKPIWEEDYNCKGGTFRMRINKRDTDKVWRELLMAAVGEQLNEYVGPNDDICGISVSVREREDVVLIWNTNAAESSIARVFDCVRMLLPDTNLMSEFYKSHDTHHAFEKQKEGHLSK